MHTIKEKLSTHLSKGTLVYVPGPGNRKMENAQSLFPRGFYTFRQKRNTRVGNVAQQAKVLPFKPGNLNLIPRTQVEGKN